MSTKMSSKSSCDLVSPSIFSSKNFAAQIREWVRLFWLLVPAARAAADLGLGRKAVLRYYMFLRQAIVRQAERELEQLSGHRKRSGPTLSRSPGSTWTSGCGRHLEGFHHQRIDYQDRFADGKAHLNGIANFRGFAKHRVKLYQGGFKKNFGGSCEKWNSGSTIAKNYTPSTRWLKGVNLALFLGDSLLC